MTPFVTVRLVDGQPRVESNITNLLELIGLLTVAQTVVQLNKRQDAAIVPGNRAMADALRHTP